MAKRRKKQQAGPLSSPVIVLAVAAAVVLAGLGLTFALAGSFGSNGPADPAVSGWPAQAATTDGDVALPEYVLAAAAEVQMAYTFAVERPDAMVWIPCYCGCGQHSGHLSAHNCFVKNGSTPANIQFDSHGAGCAMCVGIALDVKTMIEEGRSLRDIRAYIDGEYGSIGPGTDTPLPPG